MKMSLHHIFVILFLAILAPDGILSVQAQDASYPTDSYESESVRERDRSVYTAGEYDPLLNNKNQVIRDSISYRPGLSRPSRAQQAEESGNAGKSSSEEDDESILSFNFLYYLVEKYKMQDIVD